MSHTMVCLLLLLLVAIIQLGGLCGYPRFYQMCRSAEQGTKTWLSFPFVSTGLPLRLFVPHKACLVCRCTCTAPRRERSRSQALLRKRSRREMLMPTTEGPYRTSSSPPLQLCDVRITGPPAVGGFGRVEVQGCRTREQAVAA